ncbi:MAG: FecR domain-containing protein [Xanthobacteraceae bacterium]
MRHHAIALAALALAALIVQSPPVAAQQSGPPAAVVDGAIGKVVTAEGTATIEHTAVLVVQVSAAKAALPAKVGDFVYKGDVIQTGADGKVGLAFADGTALNVFNNARMELNEFVYEPNGKWNSSAFNLVKGAFTFVGGKMARTGSLKVNTPTATMGIRGTSAHVVVGEDGSVKFSTLVEEKQ